MNGPRAYDRRPPARWWRAVCVLGLLAGVLAMHGLAPGGGTGHGHTGAHSHAHVGGADPVDARPGLGAAVEQGHHADPVAVTAPVAGCAHDDGGGHARHADPTCASGAVGGGPVLPALVLDPVPAAARADAVRAYAAEAPDGARAPPSLAELQLLRI
ncbi:DUF6153 family protein [Streptomyces sp. DH24]|uniref:DUF6153 family protein n=1 Tax=Streptomyces sp. DH24 TaxID=3040123 RepID=UPI00244340E2|nr:DUF6153 family protein [Streptomyces sp. DH24]MDG9717162.1 DUF6153 family protein [Streptomyces sp. DH24]